MRESLRRAWGRRGGDACALACVAVFFVAFFGWLWLNGLYVVGGDAFAYSYPLRRFAWDEIGRGGLPLWTPHVLSGYPLLAMSQAALGYPLTWGYLFMPAHAAEQVFVLAPFLLAPALTYAYCRETGRSRLAALLAGLSFGYGGAMTNLLGVIGFPTNAFLWLPLLLTAVERARTRPLARCLALAGAAYAMSVLTGYGQGFLLVALVAGAYALFVSLAEHNSSALTEHDSSAFTEHDSNAFGEHDSNAFAEYDSNASAEADSRAGTRSRGARGLKFGARWRPLVVCVGGVACGACVGAFQILETMRAVRRSVRGTLSQTLFLTGSLPPREALASLAAPLHTARYADVSTYVSPLVLALAALAVVNALRRHRDRVRDARDSTHDARDSAREQAFKQDEAFKQDARASARGAQVSASDARTFGRDADAFTRDAQVLTRDAQSFKRDARVFFWLAAALVSFVLILGEHTPVYSLLHGVPVLNLFRVPSRHAFEWTFALSVLAAYGIDALLARTRVTEGARPADDARANDDARDQATRQTNVSATTALGPNLFVTALLVAACGAVGYLWLRATGVGLFDYGRRAAALAAWTAGRWYEGLGVAPYLVWKSAFTALAALALWRALRLRGAHEDSRARATSLDVRRIGVGAVVLVSCFFEPFISVKNWWQPYAKPGARFESVAPSTAWLRGRQGDSRVFTRVGHFADEFEARPRVDPPNLTVLSRLNNASGYEPLVLERYSRAFGGVWIDMLTELPGGGAGASVFDARSHVLDLLAVRYVSAREPRANAPATVGPLKDGVRVSPEELYVALRPGESVTLAGAAGEADALALVTSLAGSVEVAQGERVARVRAFAAGGRVIETELLAGVDTAEWARDRADVRASARHALAPVFDASPGDAENSFRSHRYWSLRTLGARLPFERIEIENASPRALLTLSKATLFDSTTGASYTLARGQRAALTRAEPERWRTAFEQDGVFIIENLRALPRAWLVAEATAVDGEEALRRIRGEAERSGSATERVGDESARGLDSSASSRDFDPRRTALLEVTPSELPALPGGEVAAGSEAHVVSYEANSLVVETESASSAVLVVSEIFYPGWEATVDGQSQPILLTNYLLRGVALPAGKHRVEMRYTAPAARNGAIISALALVSLVALTLAPVRARGGAAGARDV